MRLPALLLALGALLPQQEPDPASRCGSGIAWLSTAEEAAAAAKKSGRLILWYVPAVAPSAGAMQPPMERLDVIDDYLRGGPWAMPDVVAMVNARFVPLKLRAKGELARQAGIRTLDFVEPGLVFLDADLKVVHKVDRISTFSEEWFVHLLRELGAAEAPATPAGRLRRQRKAKEAEEELAKGGPGAALEKAKLRAAQGRWAEGLEALGDDASPEAAWLRGALLHNLNRDPEGREAWKALVAAEPKSPWAWKAALELKGRGPFVRGFEELEWLPEAPAGRPTSTIRPRTAKERELCVKRSVALLRRLQRASGAWTDSVYVFGGVDSIPNVTVAGTAIACTALLAWREVDPEGVKAALDRAWPYLLDEANTAPADEDEILWAHTYRIQYLCRLAAAEPERKAKALEKVKELVGKLATLQKKSGIWQHEYDNPFATASVLHALREAADAKVEVPEAIARRGAEALAACRGANGTFGYYYGERGGPPQQAAGRMPYCELALLLNGRSDAAKLSAAVASSFERHALLERVRKYDNHADSWQNGGFFFWYDMVGRAEAIRRLGDERGALLAKQRDLALSIAEIDGTFVDSHELGKSYGTAMALVTLELCGK